MARPDTAGEPSAEGVGSATRALAEATAALTKLLGQQVASTVGGELSDAIAASLREAARGLADASEKVDKHTGGMRAHERRQARVDRTRADLLDAAARLFAARGYGGASVGDIAAEAGYTKGALYAHFSSKNELFLALARQRLRCPEAPDDAAGSGGAGAGGAGAGGVGAGGAGDLAAELTAGLRASVDDPSMLLSIEALAFAVRNPESRPDLSPLVDTTLENLAGRVRDDRLARLAQAHATNDGAPDDATSRTITPYDRDTALALFAVTNVAAIVEQIRGHDPDDSPGARLIQRVLGG